MKYNIIAIEREYASGGKEVGERAAKALGIPCYGREILELAAKSAGTTPEHLEHLEERPTNSLLYSMSIMGSTSTAGLTAEDALYLAEAEIIWKLASQGPCVIIGHCAGVVLRERKDVLSVFVHAGLEARKQRAVNAYGVEPGRAQQVLRIFDRRRATFYHTNSHRKWDDPAGYHMILDSEKLGVPCCADLIQHCAAGADEKE